MGGKATDLEASLGTTLGPPKLGARDPGVRDLGARDPGAREPGDLVIGAVETGDLTMTFLELTLGLGP